MTTTQTNSELIEAAAKTQKGVFIIYMIVLVVGGLISAGLTYWLTHSTDEYNELVKKDADARIEEAQNSAAKANARAAFLEKQNLQLEARIAPRRLSPEMQSEIAASLKAFSGRTVVVKSYALDIESVGLGQQIIDSLHLAKIAVINQLLSAVAFNSVNVGVHITGKDKDLTESLIQSLSSIGHLDVSDQVIHNTAPHGFNLSTESSKITNVSTTVFIGIKPLQ